MKHKYKEKCDCCGKWSFYYAGHSNKLICDECFKKTNGKIELDEPVQTTIFDFIEENKGKDD